MIPPERIPANTPRDNVVLVESVKILELASPIVSQAVISRAAMVVQLVNEVTKDVPDADFIEVRAIRYDVKGDDSERTISGPPDG